MNEPNLKEKQTLSSGEKAIIKVALDTTIDNCIAAKKMHPSKATQDIFNKRIKQIITIKNKMDGYTIEIY